MDDPKTWILREELVSEYEKLQENEHKPSKAEQWQTDILHDEELRHLKAARRNAEETNPKSTSKGRMKRIASTEEPRGSEEDKQKREQRRLVLMTQAPPTIGEFRHAAWEAATGLKLVYTSLQSPSI